MVERGRGRGGGGAERSSAVESGRVEARRARAERLGEAYGTRSRSASKRSETFEEEDEAIEITRAELEKLRDRIDQARSDAGYSSSSRHSSRAVAVELEAFESEGWIRGERGERGSRFRG